ncbi:MAG: hypothetical protein HY317_01750 [Acidobacteria bacterium]|nr:hypothetical protein [Acidobacteriota bacterium]
MTRAALGGILTAAVLGTGCLVHVERVSDPRPAFERAREQALRVQGRPGPAHELNVLAWDPDDRELVRVSLPMWLCRKMKGEVDLDDVAEGAGIGRHGRHVRWEDVERAGLGVLVEVAEDDGGQVLVWLR